MLLTDQGTNFTSNVLKEINQYWGVKQSLTTPYHPQCDGMVERFNRTLASMMATQVDKTRRNWDEILPYLLFAYRTTVHSATGETPFYLMYGRDAITPTDLMLGQNLNPDYADEFDFKLHMRARMEQAWTLAQDHIEKHQEKVREKQIPDDVFQVLDLVRLHSPALKAGVAAKFHRPWDGPYRVLKIQESNMLIKKIGSRKPPIFVHMDRCKLAVPRAKQLAAKREVPEEVTVAPETDEADESIIDRQTLIEDLVEPETEENTDEHDLRRVNEEQIMHVTQGEGAHRQSLTEGNERQVERQADQEGMCAVAQEPNTNNIENHQRLPPVIVTENSDTSDEIELPAVEGRYPARRRQPVVRFLAVMITIMLQPTAAEVPLTEIIRRAAHTTAPYYIIYERTNIKISCNGLQLECHSTHSGWK